MGEYKIPKTNLASLLERIDRLNKVAVKLGQSPIVVTVGAEEIVEASETCAPTLGIRKSILYVHITVDGVAPKVMGWTFVAAIDHLFAEDGERLTIIRKPSDGNDNLPDQYRNPEPFCDHCQQTRQRKTTYILRSDDGEYKQVGSSCLRDFLGHTDPEALAALFENITEALREASDQDHEPSSGATVIRLSDLLAYTNHIARSEGWVSRKASNERHPSTSDRVIEAIFPTDSDKAKAYSELNKPTDEDIAAAQKCIEWAKQLCEAERTSDYEWSLCSIAKLGYIVGWKHIALAVSTWAAWNRELGIDPRKPTEIPVPGVFQGSIGEKLERTVQVRRIIPIETDFGLLNIHVLTDADENTYVWKASGGHALPEGQELHVKGTVKAHEAKYGKNQTVLTRVKEVKA